MVTDAHRGVVANRLALSSELLSEGNVKLSTLLDKARTELGYTEDPPGSNITKYAANSLEIGQPWCGSFVDWCFAGTSLLPGSVFYTPAGAHSFQRAARWSQVPSPGAVVFMTFHSDRTISHVGIVEALCPTCPPGTVVTIEGNTSSGVAGSQDNGGGVFRRTRNGTSIVGFGAISYEPETLEDEDDIVPARLIRKTSTGAIAVFPSGRSVKSMAILTELQQKGLVEATFTELSDPAYDALVSP